MRRPSWSRRWRGFCSARSRLKSCGRCPSRSPTAEACRPRMWRTRFCAAAMCARSRLRDRDSFRAAAGFWISSPPPTSRRSASNSGATTLTPCPALTSRASAARTVSPAAASCPPQKRSQRSIPAGRPPSGKNSRRSRNALPSAKTRPWRRLWPIPCAPTASGSPAAARFRRRIATWASSIPSFPQRWIILRRTPSCCSISRGAAPTARKSTPSSSARTWRS